MSNNNSSSGSSPQPPPPPLPPPPGSERGVNHGGRNRKMMMMMMRPTPLPTTSSFKRVQVVYYLSRNGQLEHPHYIEVSHLAHQNLRLKGTSIIVFLVIYT